MVILDSKAVYDTIREIFLHRIAYKSPNCLQCPEEHGCCHGNYSLELIDYQRIIAQNLIDPSLIARSGRKYKVRLLKDRNGRQHCGALDISTKKCLIHAFKPPTCCKYPLISNIHNWSQELMAWTGTCAHSDKIWATRVHAAIMNSVRDLWVHSNLLWEDEQDLFYRLKIEPVNVELSEIISRMLALKQCNWPYKNEMMTKILLEDYSETSIQTAFRLIKKL